MLSSGAAGYAVLRLLGEHAGSGKVGALVACVVVGRWWWPSSWLVARRIRVTEVVEVMEMVRRRVRR